jgi:hypothetical protein
MEFTDAGLRMFLSTVEPHLNERQRRVMFGALAEALGHGGQRRVAACSSMSTSTLSKAVREVRDGIEPSDRQRIEGGGDRPAIDKQPGLLLALDELVHPGSRGDPMSPLRWTSKSTYELSAALQAQGWSASPELVRRLLHQIGYSLQAPAKVIEGSQHPDRDAQFCYLNDLAADFIADGQPVISVDTKKKELIGNFSNGGREWQPSGEPVEVNDHDFPDRALGEFAKAIPYGVFDVANNQGWVNVGDSADTSEFAVESIRRWWNTLGKHRFGDATRLLVTADAGGSNGYRVRAWKKHLATFAAETGLTITVVHYPPGTSKWNKIEHRLFSFITKNWRGRPLVDMATIVQLIAGTTTETGLTVHATYDQNWYAKGVKITNTELAALHIHPHQWHGQWNYTITG